MTAEIPVFFVSGHARGLRGPMPRGRGCHPCTPIRRTDRSQKHRRSPPEWKSLPGELPGMGKQRMRFRKIRVFSGNASAVFPCPGARPAAISIPAGIAGVFETGLFAGSGCRGDNPCRGAWGRAGPGHARIQKRRGSPPSPGRSPSFVTSGVRFSTPSASWSPRSVFRCAPPGPAHGR